METLTISPRKVFFEHVGDTLYSVTISQLVPQLLHNKLKDKWKKLRDVKPFAKVKASTSMRPFFSVEATLNRCKGINVYCTRTISLDVISDVLGRIVEGYISCNTEIILSDGTSEIQATKLVPCILNHADTESKIYFSSKKCKELTFAGEYVMINRLLIKKEFHENPIFHQYRPLMNENIVTKDFVSLNNSLKIGNNVVLSSKSEKAPILKEINQNLSRKNHCIISSNDQSIGVVKVNGSPRTFGKGDSFVEIIKPTNKQCNTWEKKMFDPHESEVCRSSKLEEKNLKCASLGKYDSAECTCSDLYPLQKNDCYCSLFTKSPLMDDAHSLLVIYPGGSSSFTNSDSSRSTDDGDLNSKRIPPIDDVNNGNIFNTDENCDPEIDNFIDQLIKSTIPAILANQINKVNEESTGALSDVPRVESIVSDVVNEKSLNYYFNILDPVMGRNLEKMAVLVKKRKSRHKPKLTIRDMLADPKKLEEYNRRRGRFPREQKKIHEIVSKPNVNSSSYPSVIHYLKTNECLRNGSDHRDVNEGRSEISTGACLSPRPPHSNDGSFSSSLEGAIFSGGSNNVAHDYDKNNRLFHPISTSIPTISRSEGTPNSHLLTTTNCGGTDEIVRNSSRDCNEAYRKVYLLETNQFNLTNIVLLDGIQLNCSNEEPRSPLIQPCFLEGHTFQESEAAPGLASFFNPK